MTTMTRWEPLREFLAMQERMNRMNRPFRESYSPEVPEEALTTTSFAPPVDIYEDEHNITLKMEVPGIDEKDIDVNIENITLTVRGERKFEKEEKEENFRRIERQYGSFTRVFTLPSSVDPGHPCRSHRQWNMLFVPRPRMKPNLGAAGLPIYVPIFKPRVLTRNC